LGHGEEGEKLRSLAVQQIPWLATIDLVSSPRIPLAQLESLAASLVASTEHTVAGQILKHRWLRVGIMVVIFVTVTTLNVMSSLERHHHTPEPRSHHIEHLFWIIICFAIIAVISRLAYLFSLGLMGPRHKVAAKRVQIGLGRAMLATRGIPDRDQRLEAFLRRLRKINTAHAPEDLQQALVAYIASFEQVANEMKTNDSVELTPTVEEQEKQLQGIIRKHLGQASTNV
jgi:BioD-like phosphotransacetylase family protein